MSEYDGELPAAVCDPPAESAAKVDLLDMAENSVEDTEETPGAVEVRVEQTPDETLVIADKQLTLRCGKSSITLTRSGKIILRGKYILSRSDGVNRIKGGSVQIN